VRLSFSSASGSQAASDSATNLLPASTGAVRNGKRLRRYEGVEDSSQTPSNLAGQLLPLDLDFDLYRPKLRSQADAGPANRVHILSVAFGSEP